MSAQQEFFSETRVKLSDLNLKVYDGVLPDESAKYPFIYLGNMIENSVIEHKGNVNSGTLSFQIHVFTDQVRKRGDLSDLLVKISQIVTHTKLTRNYQFILKSINTTIIADKSVYKDNKITTPLLHGVVDLSCLFYLR